MDVSKQIAWMRDFMQRRYGGGEAARAYDRGGVLPPGCSVTVNSTGEREDVDGN